MSDPWINNKAQRLVAGLGDDQPEGPKLDMTVFLFGVAILLFGGLYYAAFKSEAGGDLVIYGSLTAFCVILQREYQPRLRQFGLSRVPLRSRKTLAWVEAGLALTAADLGFIFGLGYLALVLLPPHHTVTAGLQPLSRVVRRPFGLMVAVVIGPVLEELFTRGYLYLVLRQNLGRRRAALISSTVFAVMHIDKPLVAVVFFFTSLIYIYLDNKARSLAPSIAAHASYNLILSVITFHLT